LEAYKNLKLDFIVKSAFAVLNEDAEWLCDTMGMILGFPASNIWI
jgi:hypothetical protein